MSAVNMVLRKKKVMTPVDVARNLKRATVGVREKDITEQVGKKFETWLDEQLNMPFLDEYITFRSTPNPIHPRYPNTILDTHARNWTPQMFCLRSQEEDVLRFKITWCLAEYFSLGVGDSDINHGYTPGFFDVLQRGCFGNFKDLLMNVTLSPQMGQWLTYLGNLPENPATGRMPDENYAREIMQLYTIGLWELHLNGERMKTGELPPEDPRYVENGQDYVPTYQQDDITNMARVFTGLTGRQAGANGAITNTATGDFRFVRDINGKETWQAQMEFMIPANHESTKPKYALRGAVDIPIGTNGPNSLNMALEALVNYPSTAPYFCKRMIRFLTSSNPSPAYVARVASVFRDDGTGQVGNLKAVWKAILLDQEAQAPVNKNKTTRIMSIEEYGSIYFRIKGFKKNAEGAGIASGAGTYPGSQATAVYNFSLPGNIHVQMLKNPSVFGRWPAEYQPQGEIANNNLVAPELHLYTESASNATFGLHNELMENIGNTLSNTPEDLNNIRNNMPSVIDRMLLILTANNYPDSFRDQLIAAYPNLSTRTDSDCANVFRNLVWEISISPWAIAIR